MILELNGSFSAYSHFQMLSQIAPGFECFIAAVTKQAGLHMGGIHVVDDGVLHLAWEQVWTGPAPELEAF